jgi:hypothetical protein
MSRKALYDDGDSEVEDFVASLESYLTSKKGSPKKWWSTEVIKLLLKATPRLYKRVWHGEARSSFP